MMIVMISDIDSTIFLVMFFLLIIYLVVSAIRAVTFGASLISSVHGAPQGGAFAAVFAGLAVKFQLGDADLGVLEFFDEVFHLCLCGGAPGLASEFESQVVLYILLHLVVLDYTWLILTTLGEVP